MSLVGFWKVWESPEDESDTLGLCLSVGISAKRGRSFYQILMWDLDLKNQQCFQSASSVSEEEGGLRT